MKMKNLFQIITKNISISKLDKINDSRFYKFLRCACMIPITWCILIFVIFIVLVIAVLILFMPLISLIKPEYIVFKEEISDKL